MTTELPSAVLEGLRGFSTPTLGNAIETFKVRPRTEGFTGPAIVCRFPELGPVVGYAVTARISAAAPPVQEVSHTEAWRRFAEIPKPWLVVIEDADPMPVGSYWGEVNASVYKALGAVGVVTSGGVRDLPEVRAAGGFQFFSASVLVSHAYVHLVEVGGPVRVGGLEVRPGDLLHGDGHGVLKIPVEIAGQLLQVAEDIEAAERRLIEYARSGEASVEELARAYGEVD